MVVVHGLLSVQRLRLVHVWVVLKARGLMLSVPLLKHSASIATKAHGHRLLVRYPQMLVLAVVWVNGQALVRRLP